MDNRIFWATIPLEMGSTKIMIDKTKHDYVLLKIRKITRSK